MGKSEIPKELTVSEEGHMEAEQLTTESRPEREQQTENNESNEESEQQTDLGEVYEEVEEYQLEDVAEPERTDDGETAAVIVEWSTNASLLDFQHQVKKLVV